MSRFNVVGNLSEFNTTIIGNLKKSVKESFKFDFYCIDCNNLNNHILSNEEIVVKLKLINYNFYHVLQDKVLSNIIELAESGHKKLFFDEVLTYIEPELRKALINYLIEKDISFINITNDIEDTLLADYLIVIFDDKVALEGNTLDVLKEEKLLNRMGFNLPFMVDLSIQLQYYGLVDKIYLDKKDLVNDLWN